MSDSPFGENDKRVTTELATERNRFVASNSDEVLIPYAAPGSKTEVLFHELNASGKRVYTFESQANAAMWRRQRLRTCPLPGHALL